MASSHQPLQEKVKSSFRQLATAAHTLNAASDDLGKTISELDTALKDLNLGVTTWVKTTEYSVMQPDRYEYEEIGYAKQGGKWGICLRTVSGSEYEPEYEQCESWLFNDAPREMRIRAVGKLPDLLEQLIKEATRMAQRITEKVAEAKNLTAAVSAAAKKPSSQSK